MVTDLQGKANILSDPAIHSMDPKIFKERTNFAETGINNFFLMQHPMCSQQLCHKLAINNARPGGVGGLVDIADELQTTEKVHIACELCNQVKQLSRASYDQ